MARWNEILPPFSYQLEHQAGRLHGNAANLLFRFTQCASLEKRDRRPIRAEIEAELQQIEKIQTRNIVARDKAAAEHPVATVYNSIQTGEPLTPEEVQLGGTELTRLYARKAALLIRTKPATIFPF